jgi:hypothetical protein
MMPFYIVKKLVQNHQQGQLKQLIAKQQNQPLIHHNQSELEQKLSNVDDQFRNFFFDL